MELEHMSERATNVSGTGPHPPGRRVRGSIDSWGSKVGSTARSTPLKIGPSTGFSSTSELSWRQRH
eukprot:1148073-Pelagomonas_calceolata.AAC.17